MTKKIIRFNHLYKKLLNEHNDAIETATLLMARVVRIDELPQAFLDYDTEGMYSLGYTGFAIMLVFLKEAEGDYCCATNLFTTLREYSIDKYYEYYESIGDVFEIKIGEVEDELPMVFGEIRGAYD